MRTARAMGLRTVAVFTAPDRDAPHVREADEALEVPGYLDIDAIVDAARRSGAGAIHPGYGFLSERSAFARAIEGTEGVLLVGPGADVMDAMGKKDAARENRRGRRRARRPVVRPRRRSGRLRLPRAGQGRGRWRRQGHAHRPCAQRVRRRAGRRSPRGAERVRRRHDPRREVRRARSPHRGAGARRPPRQRGAPLRARLLDPAPPPEGARGGARPHDHRRPARVGHRPAPSPWRRRSATPTRARSSSCSTATPARSTSSR